MPEETNNNSLLTRTQIHHSSSNDIQNLISDGANVNIGDEDNSTPLHWAVHNVTTDVIQVLVNAGANVNAIDDYGKTPLRDAILVGNSDAAMILINAGSELNIKKDFGYSDLHAAISERVNDTVVKTMLKYGADVNAQKTNGTAPIHLATEYDDSNVLKMLIDYRADVNARDVDGNSPLHYTSFYNNSPHNTDILINAGANVNTINTFKQTPLHKSLERSTIDLEIIKRLLIAGANTTFRDINGNTPIDIANRNKHTDIGAATYMKLMLCL